jgi:hypothetical protein
MKMEDMSLSGLDNTKLEVSSGLHFHHPIMFGGSCPALKQEVAHVVSFVTLLYSLLSSLAQDIYSDLVEDACLGLCFEVHRAVKQGYFFLDDTDQESMKDFG